MSDEVLNKHKNTKGSFKVIYLSLDGLALVIYICTLLVSYILQGCICLIRNTVKTVIVILNCNITRTVKITD